MSSNCHLTCRFFNERNQVDRLDAPPVICGKWLADARPASRECRAASKVEYVETKELVEEWRLNDG